MPESEIPAPDPLVPAAGRPDTSAKIGPLLEKIAAFDGWFTALRRGAPSDPAAGVALARTRRAALKELIALDPRAALTHAIPRGLRTELPRDIVAQLETPVDAFGQFEVVIVCGGPTDLILRNATIGDRRYEAHVYGRRLAALSKHRLPIHGIALDERLAIDERPYRRLEPAETGRDRELSAGLAVAVGDNIRAFASPEALDAWSERMTTAEVAPGPVTSDSDPVVAADTASWVFGEKTVLWLRAEFPDDPGSPATDQEIADVMTGVNGYYAEVSRNRTSFKPTVFPGTLRTTVTMAMVNSAPARGERMISDDVLQQARNYDATHGATGQYNPDRYDRWIVVFKRAGFTWSGLALLGAKSLWLNGSVNAAVVAHELGHNQGLRHSHAWKPSSASPIQPGDLEEYGDLFDVMGYSASIPSGHFNTKQKTNILYLAAAEAVTATTSGTYRINRTDHSAASGVQAVKIAAGSAYDYWLELRQQRPSFYLNAAAANRLRSGVLLHWGSRPSFATGDGTFLLDTTPQTTAGMHDAALALGETFTDPAYGINITPIATGGTSPAEWIDVRVEFGATGSNRNPVLAASPPTETTLVARTDITFTASATDPDGDTVYYRWDFGDEQINPTTATVQHRWLKGGNYNVSVTALDGKGGLANKSFTASITDPLATWTRRGAGLTSSTLYSVIYGGGRFMAAGDSGTILLSSDGITWSAAPVLPGRFLARGLAFGNGRYVAAGSVFGSSGWTGGVYWSADGSTWQAGATPAGAVELNAVAAGAGRFVAVGRTGKIYTSPDGAAWTEIDSPVTSELNAICFAGSLFVCAGQSGRVLTSADGQTWTNRSVASSASFTGTARLGTTWYVTNGTEVWISTDGAAWNKATVTPGLTGNSLTATPNGLLLMGATGGKIALAENERVWSSFSVSSTDTSTVYYGLAEGNGVVVAVGRAGILYTAGSPVASPPVFTTQPATQTVVAGQGLTLSTAVSGTGPFSYQWMLNGANIAGATNATYTLAQVQPSDAGSYTVAATNSAGAATSRAAVLTVNASRISNMSVRTSLVAGQVLFVGFVTDGAKPLLVRGVGPCMATVFPQFFRPADVFADPRLELYNAGSVKIDENDNWNSSHASTMTTVGAFPLTPGSKDAALVASINGQYTAQLKGTGTGVVLVDAYDTTSSFSPRLTNVSARNFVGTGANALIAGFVIEGNTGKVVLIRGIGPALRDHWNVPGVLADPKVEVFNAANTKLAENDNWAATLTPMFDLVGAYRFLNGSKDAALLITLPPGIYSAVVSGVGSTTGEGVVEVYEMP